MLDYVLLILGFSITVIAATLETSKKDKTGKKRITRFGYLTLALGGIMMLISGYLKYKSGIKGSEKQAQMNLVEETVVSTSDTIQKLNELLSQSHFEVDSLTIKVDSYKEILDELRNQSARQLQQVYNSYITLFGGQTKQIESKVYSGSFLSFFGTSTDGLILEYGSRRVLIDPFDDDREFQIPIIGPSGEEFNWSITCPAGESSFKLTVESTPRSRSERRSNEEEIG